MSFTVPNFEQIRDAVLRDIVNQNPQAVVGADSDFRLRSNSTAAALEGVYQHQVWMSRQMLPDTADDDYLLRHAAFYLLTLKAANAATGTITFNGTPGAIINIGTECKPLDGSAYLTTVAGTIPAGGSLSIAARASMPGLAGNQAVNTTVTLTAAPAGVVSAGLINTMTGGTDNESIASLLTRLLARLRQPPAGGNKYDYVRWALEVPGVTQAFCYAGRRGVGSVDVAILSNGASPSSDLLAATQAHIDDTRPATSDFMALSPQPVIIAISAVLVLKSGTTLAAVTTQAQVLMAAYFSNFVPGDTAYKSRLFSLLSDIDGVVDVTPIAPAANVITLVDASHVQIPALGLLTLGT
ncbi:MAG: baseplate J/gp47 family protein [Undibacterium sp.]|uniref:baseplate J/gp47 family protein n=1 Tax=Undibacterium sp. TaxID=1914977 RepID=UPI002717FA0B|nr:baseplate J/gp47 family protein [Undibacterium sp.]MDO8654182.1 baseplate J/gp47 family protein [Undibacterium sp.]